MTGDATNPSTKRTGVARIVAAILVAALAFAIGYVAAPRGTIEPDHGLSGQTRLPPDVASGSAPSDLLSLKGEPLTAPEIDARIQRVLTVVNRSDRMRALTDLLMCVDANNWRPIMDTLIPQLERNGMAHGYEWSLVLQRVGESAGRVAVEESMPAKDDPMNVRTRHLLAGWSNVNPKAAIEWFDLRRLENQRGLLIGLVSGVSQSDPKRAFSLLAPMTDGSVWSSGTVATFNAAIQSGGLRAGEELYAWAQQQPGFHRKFVEGAFGRLAQKYEDIYSDDNSPGPLLTWFSRHFPLDPRFQGEADDVAKNVISKATQLDASATLQWLDAQSSRLDRDLSDGSYTTLATEWQAAHLDQFIAWVLANPEHPQHAIIARAGVKALLIRENPAQARAMAETVRDEESRRQLAALISEAEAKPAKTAAKVP